LIAESAHGLAQVLERPAVGSHAASVGVPVDDDLPGAPPA
jgi:hypothetical protein